MFASSSNSFADFWNVEIISFPNLDLSNTFKLLITRTVLETSFFSSEADIVTNAIKSTILSFKILPKDNNKNYQWISTFPADTPFFKNQILKDFLKKINMKEGKLFFIKSNNTRHNIFGLWSIDLMDKLEEDLDNGERKVEVWANSVGVKNINMKFENKDPFFNINTKEDLKKAIENL